LRGKGQPGAGDGPAGDALIEIGVRPHRLFSRDGDDIRFELPISLSEAVLGGKIRVPTPSGTVMATVPKWSSSGKVLRLRGKGVPRRDGSRGDAYAKLAIMLPDQPDPALESFVADWPAGQAHQPRQKLVA
jgi:DnaJ-class molecular chaperone